MRRTVSAAAAVPDGDRVRVGGGEKNARSHMVTTTQIPQMSESHDRVEIIPWLVPYEATESDPVELLAELRRGVEALPETRAVFKLSDVLEGDGREATRKAQSVPADMPLLLGSWSKGKVNGTRQWINPNYCHLTTYGDLDFDRSAAIKFGDRYERTYQQCQRERIAWGAKCALHGLSQRWPAARAGVTESRYSDIWHSWAPVAYQSLRKRGTAAIYRALHLCYEWGKTYEELAEAMGTTPASVKQNVYRYSRKSGFVPPAPPTDKNVRFGRLVPSQPTLENSAADRTETEV